LRPKDLKTITPGQSGKLILSIGKAYNHPQISGLYTRLMRDEVLAEWRKDQHLLTF
jgi:hypothetical protein